MTDGTVQDMAEGFDGTIYLAGDFSNVGPFTGNAIPINSSTTSGTLISPYPKVEKGIANSIISDGSGGWFIGGTFTQIGGVAKAGLAHILSNGSIDSSWNASVDTINSDVRDMIIYGGNLYFGGQFTVVNGQSRSNLAAVSVADGTLQS